jgi:hypothetical protein
LKLTITILFLGANLIFNYAQKNTSDAANTAPKEFVFVLHGLAGGGLTISPLANRIEDAGYETKIIDYKTLGTTPEEIMLEVSSKIKFAMPLDTNMTINFVGYSLGSIVIRAYLDRDTLSNLGRVVLIAPPNKGSPLADFFKDTWIIDLFGETIQLLGTDSTSFPNSIGDPYYPVGIIAGVGASSLNNFYLPGLDDGIVPLESTKLNNATDIIAFDESHIFMKFKKKIANQTIEFLKNGKFRKSNSEN